MHGRLPRRPQWLRLIGGTNGSMNRAFSGFRSQSSRTSTPSRSTSGASASSTISVPERPRATCSNEHVRLIQVGSSVRHGAFERGGLRDENAQAVTINAVKSICRKGPPGVSPEYGSRPFARSIGADNHTQAKNLTPNQIPMSIIIRFSVKEMNPRGTLDDPPTQAHLSSRLSM